MEYLSDNLMIVILAGFSGSTFLTRGLLQLQAALRKVPVRKSVIDRYME